MKKTYVNPEIELVELKYNTSILSSSPTTDDQGGNPADKDPNPNWNDYD